MAQKSKKSITKNRSLPYLSKVLSNCKATLAKPTRHYALESFLLLMGIGVLLFVSVFMFNTVFDYFLVENALEELSYDAILTGLVVVIVVLPLSVGLYKRVRNRELKQPDVTNNKWRRFILNTFLLILFISFVTILAVLLKATITELVTLEVGASSDTALWHQYGRLGFSLILIGGLYKYLSVHTSDRPKLSDKKFIRASSIIIAILVILLIAFPLRALRGAYIDDFVESDIQALSSEVNAYYANRGDLPFNLDELDLDNAIEKRRETFSYDYRRKSSNRYSGGAYELCASFKTDTTAKLPNYSSNSLYDNESKVSFHRAGLQCFDFSTNSYSPYFLNGGLEGTPPRLEESIFEGLETLTQ